MMKTKIINPTFLTQSTTPKVNVRLMGFNAIEFTVEGLRENIFELCRENILSKIFAEDAERLTDAWIFINFMTKNRKIVERQLERDEEKGVWMCEFRDSGLVASDVIEYWMFVEKNSVGFYSSEVIRIEGEIFLDLI